MNFQPFRWILQFPLVFWKSRCGFLKKSSFPHPLGQAAQKLVKPMKLHPFLGVLGAFGHNFRKINFCTEITRNAENMISLLDSDFCIKSEFEWNGWIARTPMFYCLILRFSRAQIHKMQEFHKFHHFTRIYVKFTLFGWNRGILWFPLKLRKTMPARSAPQQMRSDLDNPKELHSFLEGQFLTEMMNLTRIRK